MDEYCRRAMALEGQTLQTVSGEAFTIVDVDDTSAQIVPVSSAKPPRVARTDLERALPLKSPGQALRPSETKARLPNLRHHNGVAALIDRLAQSS